MPGLPDLRLYFKLRYDSVRVTSIVSYGNLRIPAARYDQRKVNAFSFPVK